MKNVSFSTFFAVDTALILRNELTISQLNAV